MTKAEMLLDPATSSEISRVLRGALEIKDRDRHIMEVYSRALDTIGAPDAKTNSEFVGLVRQTVRYAREEIERLKTESQDADHVISVNPEIAGIIEECWRYWEQVKGNCGDDINLENMEFNVGLISSWVRASHALSREATQYMVYEKDADADLMFGEPAIAYLLAAQETPTLVNEDGTYVHMSGLASALTELVKVILSVCRVRIIVMNRAFQDAERNYHQTEARLRERIYNLEMENNRLKQRLEKHEPRSTM